MRVSCAGLDLCQGHDRRSYPDADPEPNRSRDRAVSRQMVHDFKFQVPVYIKIALLGHRKNEWKKGRKKKRNQSPIYNLSLSGSSLALALGLGLGLGTGMPCSLTPSVTGQGAH